MNRAMLGLLLAILGTGAPLGECTNAAPLLGYVFACTSSVGMPEAGQPDDGFAGDNGGLAVEADPSERDGAADLDALPTDILGPEVVCVGTAATFAVAGTTQACHLLSWSGGGDPAAQDGGSTFTTTWTTPGEKAVTVANGECSFGKTVTVVGIEYVKVRRMGSGNAFADSAKVAAGGFASDVHKADVEMSITPVPAGTYSVVCPVSLAHAEGYPGKNVKARLYMGGALVVEGDGSGNVTFSSADGKASGYLVSSNWMKTCTISGVGGSASASVNFDWDCLGGGAYDFKFPDYVIAEVPDEVWFYPTLNEVMGDGAIDANHSIPYYTLSADLYWYSYDFSTGREADGMVTVRHPNFSGIPFGKAMTDLIEHSATTMTAPGEYQNTQTVHEYYDIVGDEFRLIEVEGYTFAVYDEDVHL